MPGKVEAWQGAPQTIYSDHFLHTQPIDGPIGYKLEVPPLHPVIFGTLLPGFGQQQAQSFKDFPNSHMLLALMRDGFHEQAAGGRVGLRSDGSPTLDYKLTDYIMDGARRSIANGRNPVCGRCQRGLPGTRTGRTLHHMGGGQTGTANPAHCTLADQDQQRPRHGRLWHGGG
jgi:hypothetical protein